MSFKRFPAKRLFVREILNTRVQEERDEKTKYVITPLGDVVNRVFLVGVLLEVEDLPGDYEGYRLRINDGMRTITVFAGRYSQDVLSEIEGIITPSMVALTGKVRLVKGETKDFVAIRPEHVVPVEVATRNVWLYETAKYTLDKIKRMKKWMAGEFASDEEERRYNKVRAIYEVNIEDYYSDVRDALKILTEDLSIEKAIEDAISSDKEHVSVKDEYDDDLEKLLDDDEYEIIEEEIDVFEMFEK